MSDITVTMTHVLPWVRLQDLACNLNYSPPEWFGAIEFTVDDGKTWRIMDAADSDTWASHWRMRINCENPDEEGWLSLEFTPDQIRAKLTAMSEDGKYRRFIREWVEEQDDWETADCIFQYLAYDEIVFG